MVDTAKKIIRDGTSQAQRCLPKLDPSGILIDERSLEDWLAYTYALAQELHYYDENNQANGDWSDFLNPNRLKGEELHAWWQQIENFVENPQADNDDSLRRPHFQLFLGFLLLLRDSQAWLNRLTGEHLDFYYRDILRLQEQSGHPDKVSIIAQLAANSSQARIPAGSLLHAGKDSTGKALVYQTDRELLVNRAQVKSLYTVFVDKRIHGFQEVRQSAGSSPAEQLLSLFKWIYGDPLPNYPDDNPIDAKLLNSLQELIDMRVTREDFENKQFQTALENIKKYFYCSLDEFGQLMTANANDANPDWSRIEAILTDVYARKLYPERRQQLLEASKNNPIKLLEFVFQSKDTEDCLRTLDKLWSSDTDSVTQSKLDKVKTALSNNLNSQFDDESIDFLEKTWRRRLGVKPTPQVETWLNLYANNDATNAKVDNINDTPRWHTFGKKTETSMATLGWAIASPLLDLSQGERVVTLTLTFESKPDSIYSLLDKVPTPFEVSVSSAKGWINPSKPMSQTINSSAEKKPLTALIFTLTFDAAAPAIAAPPDNSCSWPLLRLQLKPHAPVPDQPVAGQTSPYGVLQALQLCAVELSVAVEGLKDLQIANDDGPLPSAKPFEPFGSKPSVGSGFQFEHPELARDGLKELSLHLEWMNLPEKLGDHYKNYPIVENGTLTKNFSVSPLFECGTSEIELFASSSVVVTLENLSANSRYRLELNAPDFQHHQYAQVAAQKTAELAIGLVNKTVIIENTAIYQVNPPYTPKLKTFTVGYRSKVELNVAQQHERQARLYHLHPFGLAEVTLDTPMPLLPEYPHQGELYIGLDGVEFNAEVQHISLLFQLAEGSANPDLPTATMHWDYLSGNRWLSLEQGHIIDDASKGLIQSGIIQFRLPQAQPNTLLPADQYWLRAVVDKHCASLCDTIALHTQAVTATWLDQNNAPGHLLQPLPANSIRKTVDPIPGIRAILQPYSSVNGKAAEQPQAFNTRVSERLRHKQRAITIWDYEHLILQQFPQLYKVKCIPADSDNPAELGKVDIIVIPDVRDRQPFNPFQPKATRGELQAIHQFIARFAPPLADISVKNAHYIAVKLRIAVKFKAGFDPGYYKTQFNLAINQYLSPWAYQADNQEIIGGSLYANALVNYLERLPYVDYVAKPKLFKEKSEQGEFDEIVDTGFLPYCVETGRPDGGLVAYPQHEIDIIEQGYYQDDRYDGVGYWIINLDFVVT